MECCKIGTFHRRVKDCSTSSVLDKQGWGGNYSFVNNCKRKVSFKLTNPHVLYLQENHGHHALQARWRKNHLNCYWHKEQKPASVKVWGGVTVHGMGNLHFFKGNINAERSYQIVALESKSADTRPANLQSRLGQAYLNKCNILWRAKYDIQE